MKSEKLTFEQLMEIGLILNDLDTEKKNLVMEYIIKANNAVIDYENRIQNAINQLQR